MRRRFFKFFIAVGIASYSSTTELALAAEAEPLQLFDDPILQNMVSDALESRPEVRQAKAAIAASRERVPSLAALPDPRLSFGLQNDGFDGLQIAKMENSYYSIGAQQTLPWPGKRSLRGDIQSSVVAQGEADQERVRLSIEANVRRAYVDLLLVRDQLRLLEQLETLWREAAGLARTRYETGVGVQADVLRAQLENSRLRQRRWSLAAQERRQQEILNRLRGKPLGSPITTTTSLGDYSPPALPEQDGTLDYAERTSPELARARAAVTLSRREVDLARREYFPDYTLSAAIMPRGGDFPTMWQLGLGVSIPLWSASKQAREVSASAAQSQVQTYGVEVIRQNLKQRVVERLTILHALLESWLLYRDGLLVQSSATAQSTMAHYRVGAVTFASVLESLAGYLNDANGYYETIAATERILIAMAEVSLDSPDGVNAGMAAPSMQSGPPGNVPARRESNDAPTGM